MLAISAALLHLLVGCVLDAEGDVFADGGAEQESFLGDEADLAAQGFQRNTRGWDVRR